MAPVCSSIVFQLTNETSISNIIQESARIYEDIFSNVLSHADPVLVLVNLFTIFILTRKQLRTAYNIVFIFMALDQGWAILCRYLLFSTNSSEFGCSFIYKLPWQLIEIAIDNSYSIFTAHVSWLAVIITFVRLRQINSSTLIEPSIRYMITLCCCSFTLILVASVPFFLSYEIYLIEMTCDSGELETVAFVEASDRLYAHDCLLLRMAFFSSGVLFNALPCVLLVFLSTSLAFRLRIIRKNHKAMVRSRSSATSAEFVRSSLMIAMIVCTTLLMNIPQAIFNILVGLMSENFQSLVSSSISSFIITLVTIASACNLAIHLSMSRQFREVTKKYVCCCCRKSKKCTTTPHANPTILPK